MGISHLPKIIFCAECRLPHLQTNIGSILFGNGRVGACLGGAVGSVAVRAARLQWSASLGSRPRLAGSLCQVTAAYALRLNYRAGTVS